MRSANVLEPQFSLRTFSRDQKLSMNLDLSLQVGKNSRQESIFYRQKVTNGPTERLLTQQHPTSHPHFSKRRKTFRSSIMISEDYLSYIFDTSIRRWGKADVLRKSTFGNAVEPKIAGRLWLKLNPS